MPETPNHLPNSKEQNHGSMIFLFCILRLLSGRLSHMLHVCHHSFTKCVSIGLLLFHLSQLWSHLVVDNILWNRDEEIIMYNIDWIIWVLFYFGISCLSCCRLKLDIQRFCALKCVNASVRRCILVDALCCSALMSGFCIQQIIYQHIVIVYFHWVWFNTGSHSTIKPPRAKVAAQLLVKRQEEEILLVSAPDDELKSRRDEQAWRLPPKPQSEPEAGQPFICISMRNLITAQHSEATAQYEATRGLCFQIWK